MRVNGLVLVTEEPYSHAVDTKNIPTVCSYCMQLSQTELKRCAKCKFVHYCDGNCQKKDWRDHKMECRALVECDTVPNSDVRLIARVLFKQKRGGEKPSFNGRTFASLISHAKEVQSKPALRNYFEDVKKQLSPFLSKVSSVSDEEFAELCGKVYFNECGISVEQKSTGKGLFIGIAELNHSCAPDAWVRFEGKKIIVYACKEGITKYEKNLTISYVDVMEMMEREKRRSFLRQRWLFDCECKVCADPVRKVKDRSLRCNKCIDGYCLYNLDSSGDPCNGRCMRCRRLLPPETLKKAVALMELLETESDSPTCDMERLLDYLRECKKYLSDCNLVMYQAALKLREWFMKNDEQLLLGEVYEYLIDFERDYDDSYY